MKTVLATMFLATLCAVSSVDAAPAAASAPLGAMPAASAASAIAPPVGLRSPAVKAAVNARQPGELRPEHAVIPQQPVSLNRKPEGPTAVAVSGSADGIDDNAARCRASGQAKERAKCAPISPAASAPR